MDVYFDMLMRFTASHFSNITGEQRITKPRDLSKEIAKLRESGQLWTPLRSILFQTTNNINMESKSETPIWEQYMPDYVNLYYADYRDSLGGHEDLLQKCISNNSMYPLSETIFDWWDYPEGIYLDEIRGKMEADDLEDVYEECEEEIKEWLWNHDKSTPIEDLLRNTSSLNAYYSLGVEVDGWHEAFMCQPWCDETDAQKAYKIRSALGIKKGTPEADKIMNIVLNANYGGNVRIYFEMQKFQNYISGNEYDEASNKQDFKSIQFKGGFMVAVWNPCEGAGYFKKIELNLNVPFIRDNLFISGMDKYSIERSCGMCSDWLSKTDEPTCLLTKAKNKKKVARSANADNLKREAELTKIFKAGGCTAGDMDMSRHRDVYYDNNVPCGHHCPHCGTFWIA